MSSESLLSKDTAINLFLGSIIPSILVALHIYDFITLTALKLLLVAFVIFFIVLPLVYKYSYSLQRTIVFLNIANQPKKSDLLYPQQHGIDGARNFYLNTNEGITLGVWQILHINVLQSDKTITNETFETELDNGQPVLLYNHGNSASRAASHRVEIYKVFRRHFHVFAYDYRSYGDSSPIEPTEDGLVKDVIFMYNWIANQTKAKVFIWGHSLGTGLSLHALSLLESEHKRPQGLFLESPFNNMRDEIIEHPFCTLFRPFPWFYTTVVNPMQENNFTFKSDVFIRNVNCPILILHAEDDRVVPFKLGRKLYTSALETRNLKVQGSIKFEGFPKNMSYGHKYICRSPKLDEIISIFIRDAVLEVMEKNL